jgi:DNA repair exonuclease SbcCD nuclease subunit
MGRAVVIGDVHSKVEDLDDCDKLVTVIDEVVEKENPNCLIFLGDLYDAFAVKNVVVERWWMQTLARYRRTQKYLVLGNHDRPGDQSAVGHALQAHAGQTTTIVDAPTLCHELGDVMLLPFYFRAENFVAAAQSSPVSLAKTLFCHQSFIGGKYESGQPIEARHDVSAVDAGVLPQKCVISGHIHTPQTTGKVWYVGAPRWRDNVSDANIDRHIVAVDFEGSLPKAIRKYATGEACKRIWLIDDKESDETTVTPQGKLGDRYVVDVTGSAAYIEARKKVWATTGTRLRTFQTDRPGPKLSEADGVPAAWGKWAGEYRGKFGTTAEVLSEMARERLAL